MPIGHLLANEREGDVHCQSTHGFGDPKMSMLRLLHGGAPLGDTCEEATRAARECVSQASIECCNKSFLKRERDF